MIKAVVTDIEGTTSSLAFVKDVLFPYARDRIAAFVHTHGRDPAVQALLAEARRLAGQALDEGAIVAQLIRWIDQDRKLTPLKALQGMIWEEGYRRGDFRGHVYEDAARRLREWHDRGLALYVFSSGSVQAQKLLFGHSICGDLTPLFSDYFDTTIGVKKEPAAYRAIAAHIGLDPGEILFLSDIREELDAARAAGLHTCWLVRAAPGGGAAGASAGAPPPETPHPVARDFDQVAL